jgi:hypothetical protein
LLPALRDTLAISERADFCVGYFNLRGWNQLDSSINEWSGEEGAQCRLLIGMQSRPYDELRAAMRLDGSVDGIDAAEATRLKKRMAQEFKDQLMLGIPTNTDEKTLRRLSKQLKEKKVVVKLFLRHFLHGKLYLIHRTDPNNPTIGFVGSSNLTFAGLSKQGELNVDVLDHDACTKLQKWFEDRWNDRWCLDISEELSEIIDTSWARESTVPPFHIYLKIAYHLSREARAGLAEFQVPGDFRSRLFEFQKAAVQIAAHHVNKRNGVLIGDVVGLGKTLMATALARIFQDDQNTRALIICPKNLEDMWLDYVDRYSLNARVLPISRVTTELANLKRYQIVLIDESHNLRNREGKRYKILQEYIATNESKCILLSATPYNKTLLDLSSQLSLFVPSDYDLGIRPEEKIRDLGGESQFVRKFQCPVRSLAAFEKSEFLDDWRELMRLYMVRRTRSFIKDNYAKIDPGNNRHYLLFEDGSRFYFPTRLPITKPFVFDENNPSDTYARLHSDQVVQIINHLHLPRYGLGNYIAPTPHEPPTQGEAQQLQGLSRAGQRLMGFCRTNLFKRLESCGASFLQSIDRHILRNYVYCYAIDNNLPLPLGTQDPDLLDEDDEDSDGHDPDDEDSSGAPDAGPAETEARSEEEYKERAKSVYNLYTSKYKRRFKWLRPTLFVDDLAADLLDDAKSLINILNICGKWDTNNDTKLKELVELLTVTHKNDKVLVFSQFADTVRYLARELKQRKITSVEPVTGSSSNPTALAWRFSPESNEKRAQVSKDDELRVLLATDVLSEGQNMQDCSIIVNYDLPWAIIRLIQRAGRVDRIGQRAEKILCYSFLPAEGVERIIRLRGRVRQRLRENAEVVGTDEAFFDDDDLPVMDIYNEKAGIYDGEQDSEVDLASFAFQIWKKAIDNDPALEKTISDLPNVVYSSKIQDIPGGVAPGVLVYLRTSSDTDALALIDGEGKSVTQSQLTILRMAECESTTPAAQRLESHHDLVKQGVDHLISEETNVGGQLGRTSGSRSRTYERLMRYRDKYPLFVTEKLEKAIEEIYRYPLWPTTIDILNRQLRSGISDADLAKLVIALREDERLCIVQDSEQKDDAQIICSMGLVPLPGV